jgi:cytochrome oxidase Cu insertion factor (SCO1/SenC/PrrC family)
MKRCCGALVLLSIGMAAGAAVDPGAAAIPRLEYEPLAPGSYELQRIQPTPDARLLDAQGRAVRLQSYTRGKITLLTFFYTYCVDPLGCPYSRETLQQVREGVLKDARLAAATRFVSVSFDPGNDTPEALARYAVSVGAGGAVAGRMEWQFLTARSVPDLLPLLQELGQDVSVQNDAQGKPTRTLHHMLKLFLIDAQGFVREIYTLAYLQPLVILNDIKTLRIESQRDTAIARSSPAVH